jgi:hypothetical protein
MTRRIVGAGRGTLGAPAGLVAAAVLAVLLLGASAARASGPAWSIVSVAEPTHLAPRTNQVDELTVHATGGFLLLYRVTKGSSNKEPIAAVPYPANPAELQAGFEEFIGAGSVKVAEGAAGAGTYRISFEGSLAATEVLLEPDTFFLSEGATATVKKLSAGGGGGQLVVTATNVGGAQTDGGTITLTDSLPAGLRATAITGFDAYAGHEGAPVSALSCSAPPVLVCTLKRGVDPGDSLIVRITVALEPSPPASVTNEASVSGGGAASASVSNAAPIGAAPAGFGIAPGSLLVAASSLRAGGHPNLTTAFALDTKALGTPSGPLKEVHFDLPKGFVGTTEGYPKCTMAEVDRIGGEGEGEVFCPRDTIVGVATTTIGDGTGSTGTVTSPVFAIEPAPGEPVAFAYVTIVAPVRLDTSVLADGEYNVRVTVPDISEGAEVLASSVTIFGVPADENGPGHNDETIYPDYSLGGANPNQARVPLLTSPQDCSEPMVAELSLASWEDPGAFVPAPAERAVLGRPTGCELLPFGSSFSMLPDTLEAGAPAGYTFSLRVPQNSEPDGVATPNVKEVKLALPVGTVISPSAAWGLRACSDVQFALHSGAPGGCPRESQVGTVEIKTPALPEPLVGEVFLAEPSCDPCTPADAAGGRMARLFVQVVAEGESGIVVKLEGRESVNQQTGQLTSTFEDNPQLPFSELKLTLGGGPRAVLANPRVCGPATSNLDLTPWSTPFTADSTPSFTFEVDQGCFGAQFAPSFVAGTTNIQAGEYSPFTLSFGRGDQEEFLNRLQLQMPPGLLGSLAHVPLCREPQAAEGTCSQESLIGHTQVLTGPGADPFLVTGGQVFLTEGYEGAPFGLSIVVPAKAGPYTLSGTTGQGTVVVRAAINVDPHTAALTVTSDPLPTALDGIPLQLRVVNVTIDRPDFTVNPTNCSKLTINGTIGSKEGSGVAVSSPFQVTNCTGLGFDPRFTVSTSAHTSRAAGANLDAKVVYPLGPKLANIAKVKVELPKRLPSRLTTLQKACPAATFAANPGGCPAASVVGIARASTPILPVQLTGPVYFVSNGGEAFPNLVVVLQGYGVRVDLVGSTFISKVGITSSTFASVPDVPVSSFELYLPQGPHSALAANGNLCTGTLTMPTTFVAQNGAVLRQATKIAVTGCPRAIRARRAKKARAAGSGRHRRRRGASATVPAGVTHAHGRGTGQ